MDNNIELNTLLHKLLSRVVQTNSLSTESYLALGSTILLTFEGDSDE